MNQELWPNPFIEQRADPFILLHDGWYYFIASVPEYDRLEIRRAQTISELPNAPFCGLAQTGSWPDERAYLGARTASH